MDTEISEGDELRKKQLKLAIKQEEFRIEEAKLRIEYLERDLRKINN